LNTRRLAAPHVLCELTRRTWAMPRHVRLKRSSANENA
jgi:hypothetical protein